MFKNYPLCFVYVAEKQAFTFVSKLAQKPKHANFFYKPCVLHHQFVTV